MPLAGFRSIKKCFIQKSVEKSGSNNIAYLHYGHASHVSPNYHFLPLLILLMSVKNKLKDKMGI